MPFTKEDPPEKIKGLPAHAQDIWISAFNNAIKQYDGDEEKANATAWAAVKKAGYEKNKEDKWVKMAEGSFNCECIECGHKIKSEKHCADIKCPECEGEMRRQERPGPGRFEDEPNFDEVEIWEAGEYPQGTFTEKDIDQIVANFDAGYHEPPVTLDHIKGGPAYGWVEKIWRNGSKLMAKFKQVSNELKTWVKEGKYKKKSIELWDDFEGTGKLVLKAVTWLGATPPQVKGLRNQFATFEDAHGRVLCMNSGEKGKNFKRGEIDMTQEEFDKMFADKMKPFEEKVVGLTKANEDLTRANDELKKNQTTHFSDEAKKRRLERIDVLVDQLLKPDENGKSQITPAYVDAGFKQFLMAQPEDAVLTFGEGDEKREVPVIDFAIEFFSNRIKGAPVAFKEISKDQDIKSDAVLSFKVMQAGEKIDGDSLEVHQKATALIGEEKKKGNSLSYRDAVSKIFQMANA